MREVKFRAWDIENKKWIDLSDDSDLHLIYEGGVWVITSAFDDDGDTPIMFDDSFALDQYIGVKDRNKKDIYEMDIVKGGKPFFRCDVLGVVGCYGMAFHFEGTNQYGEYWFHTITSQLILMDIEIIGNIREHSYLISNPVAK